MKTSQKNGKKTETKQEMPTFHAGLRSKAEAKKALEQRDQIAVDAYADELKTRREQVLALDDFIFEVLSRSETKALPKPGAAVVRALINEKGMTTFTANRHWNEFRLLCMAV